MKPTGRRATGPTTTVVAQDADVALPDGFGALVAACTAADDHGPFGEHTLLTLHGQSQVRHSRLAAHMGTSLIGYAVLSEGLDAWYVELAVVPEHRGRRVGTALLEAARVHVASHGGGVLRGWAHAAGPAVERLAAGWRTARTLRVLERSLGAELPVPRVPAGLVLRTLDPTDEADRDAWLALSNAAFAGHPENGGWTRADLDWRMDAAWTCSSSPVLQDDSGLVAGVWNKIDGDAHGELYVVAVHPCRQGRGLGAVVVAAAVRALAAQGCRRAALYVEADNGPAVRLYDRVGFGLHHVDRCYELDVAARA